MDLVAVLLRFVHIAAAIAWAGGAFFVLSILDPMMGRIGPGDASRFMRHVQLRTKLSAYFPVVAVLTVAGGLALYYDLHLNETYPMSILPGQIFHLGVAAGLLGLVWGGSMEGRLNGKLGKLARRIEAGPADAALEKEFAATSAKLRSATRVSGLLMVVAMFGMSTFRYF